MSTAQHVIFGTGAIGLATYDALRRHGETVRLVNRSGHAQVPDDVEVVAGDARDPAFTRAVAQGAAVLYQTLNPPYHEWTAQFPALQAGVLAAGARLVSMENVYMYGRSNEHPFSEDRSYAAHTKKGQLRAGMARDLLAAHQAGRVQVAIGRASDYFGAGGGAQSNLATASAPRRWPARPPPCSATPTSRTRTPTSRTSAKAWPSSANTPTPLARCGTCPTTPTPTPPASSSTSSTQDAGQPRAKVRAMPPLLLRGLGLINPTLRELAETLYQFDEPFIVDSSKIAAKLGVHATPIRHAPAETSAPIAVADPCPQDGFDRDGMKAANGTPGRSSVPVAGSAATTSTALRKPRMQAMLPDRYGSAEGLRVGQKHRPTVGDGEVLVHMCAAGVDRGTWHFMAGMPYLFPLMRASLRKPKNPVLGLEVAVHLTGARPLLRRLVLR